MQFVAQFQKCTNAYGSNEEKKRNQNWYKKLSMAIFKLFSILSPAFIHFELFEFQFKSQSLIFQN